MASRSGIDHQEKAAFPSSTHSFNKVGNVQYPRPTPGAPGSKRRASGHVALGKAQWGPPRPYRAGLSDQGQPQSLAGEVAILDGGGGIFASLKDSPALSEEPRPWRGVLEKRVPLRKRLNPAPSSPPPEMQVPEARPRSPACSWQGLCGIRWGSRPDPQGGLQSQRLEPRLEGPQTVR